MVIDELSDNLGYVSESGRFAGHFAISIQFMFSINSFPYV